jgi:hypothetical protein
MPDSIPPETVVAVRLAIAGGNKIEAIKILRAAVPELGLAEAKAAVEQIERGGGSGAVPLPPSVPAVGVPPGVSEALAAGNKIEAIKLYREAARVGLKEAKDAVEAIERQRLGLPSNAPLKSGCLGLLVACAVPLAVLIAHFVRSARPPRVAQAARLSRPATRRMLLVLRSKRQGGWERQALRAAQPKRGSLTRGRFPASRRKQRAGRPFHPSRADTFSKKVSVTGS